MSTCSVAERFADAVYDISPGFGSVARRSKSAGGDATAKSREAVRINTPIRMRI
jgi:hypothetical protein